MDRCIGIDAFKQLNDQIYYSPKMVATVFSRNLYVQYAVQNCTVYNIEKAPSAQPRGLGYI